MAQSGKPGGKLIANRKALRDYLMLERCEAGIELQGTEVKSIKAGRANLTGAFARIENREAFLHNFNVLPYEYGNVFNHEANRPRRLLLHRREIGRLQVQIEQKGHALIPINIYLRKGLVKVELALCKGKRHSDKREILRKRTAEREAQRAMRDRRGRA
jgi:SsrA-binding protein